MILVQCVLHNLEVNCRHLCSGIWFMLLNLCSNRKQDVHAHTAPIKHIRFSTVPMNNRVPDVQEYRCFLTPPPPVRCFFRTPPGEDKDATHTLHLLPFFICLHFSGGGRMFGLAATCTMT